MTPEEIDQIAEATAGKIAVGLLRMPDEVRQAIEDSGVSSYGYFTAPGLIMPSPNAYYLEGLVRSSGIELRIKRPDGSVCWQSVIM